MLLNKIEDQSTNILTQINYTIVRVLLCKPTELVKCTYKRSSVTDLPSLSDHFRCYIWLTRKNDVSNLNDKRAYVKYW